MKFFNFLSDSRPALVEQSIQDLVSMLATAGDMFASATSYLLENEALTVDLSAQDELVNKGEQGIRRAVLEHIAVDPRDELTLSLLMLSVVQDAERCGDLAKSIAKAADMADSPRMGAHVESLRVIRDKVQALFPKARAAFLSADAAAARSVMDVHDALKKDVTQYLKTLADSDEVTTNQAVVLAVSARMIGRVSSHLSNIISSVAMPFDQIRSSPTWGDDE